MQRRSDHVAWVHPPITLRNAIQVQSSINAQSACMYYLRNRLNMPRRLAWLHVRRADIEPRKSGELDILHKLVHLRIEWQSLPQDSTSARLPLTDPVPAYPKTAPVPGYPWQHIFILIHQRTAWDSWTEVKHMHACMHAHNTPSLPSSHKHLVTHFPPTP